jgi:ABC-type branched-subunit amino acid transport system substrate-binding protein
MINVLKTETFDTPIGKIGFDEFGDVTGYGYTVYQIKTARA